MAAFAKLWLDLESSEQGWTLLDDTMDRLTRTLSAIIASF